MRRKIDKWTFVGLLIGLLIGVAIGATIIGISDAIHCQMEPYSYVGYFKEEVAVAKKNGGFITFNTNYGYINEDGETVIDFKYKNAKDFYEGLAAATLDNKTYGYIDHEGNWVIEPQFNWAGSFHDGEATVRKGIHHYKIDHQGNILQEVKGD